MNVDYGVVGQRIKARRKHLNWTQDHLAESLSVSVGYISQVERGVTKVSLDTLSEIALQLKCDLVEFLSGVSPAQENYRNRELMELYQRMNQEQKNMFLDMANVILKYR